MYFDTSYKDNPKRKALSLLTLPTSHNDIWMSKPKSSTFTLNPLMSNLLPEGSLRELICNNLDI